MQIGSVVWEEFDHIHTYIHTYIHTEFGQCGYQYTRNAQYQINIYNNNNNRETAIEVTQEIGRRITVVTEDTGETEFLFQRLSMALQRGNAVSFQNTMISEWNVVAAIYFV